MREIKFRAWNGSKFIFVYSLYWVSAQESLNNTKGFNVNEYLGVPENHVQQFTGLKDKNGR